MGDRERKRWTQEEKEFLINNYSKYSLQEMAEVLGRSICSVKCEATKHHVKSNRFWTEEEVQFIEDHYGDLTIKQIAKRLGRDYTSVGNKINRMQIGAFHEISDFVTLAEFSRMIGVHPNTIRHWIKRGWIKGVKKSRFYLFKLDKIYQFMQNNPERWKAINCDKDLFEYFPWYHEKLLAERKENDRRYA